MALAQRTGGTWQLSSLVFRGFLHQPLSDESVVSIATSLGTTRYTHLHILNFFKNISDQRKFRETYKVLSMSPNRYNIFYMENAKNWSVNELESFVKTRLDQVLNLVIQ